MKRQNHINSIYSSTHKNFNDEYLTFSKFKFLFVLSFSHSRIINYLGVHRRKTNEHFDENAPHRFSIEIKYGILYVAVE